MKNSNGYNSVCCVIQHVSIEGSCHAFRINIARTSLLLLLTQRLVNYPSTLSRIFHAIKTFSICGADSVNRPYHILISSRHTLGHAVETYHLSFFKSVLVCSKEDI